MGCHQVAYKIMANDGGEVHREDGLQQAPRDRASHAKTRKKKHFINDKQRRLKLRFVKEGCLLSSFPVFRFAQHLVQWLDEIQERQCLAPTVKFDGRSTMIWKCFNKTGIRQIHLCEGHMNDGSPTLRTVFSSMLMIHATQPG